MGVVDAGVDDADDDARRSGRGAPGLIGFDVRQSPELVVQGVVGGLVGPDVVVRLGIANLGIDAEEGDRGLDHTGDDAQHVRPGADRLGIGRPDGQHDRQLLVRGGPGLEADQDGVVSEGVARRGGRRRGRCARKRRTHGARRAEKCDADSDEQRETKSRIHAVSPCL